MDIVNKEDTPTENSQSEWPVAHPVQPACGSAFVRVLKSCDSKTNINSDNEINQAEVSVFESEETVTENEEESLLQRIEHLNSIVGVFIQCLKNIESGANFKIEKLHKHM